jgi:hypothetical protein
MPSTITTTNSADLRFSCGGTSLPKVIAMSLRPSA